MPHGDIESEEVEEAVPVPAALTDDVEKDLGCLVTRAQRKDKQALETHKKGTKEQDSASASRERMADAVKTLLECLGEDPYREGLLKTPTRYADALMFLTSGYKMNLQTLLNGAIFEEPGATELVIVRDIEIHSLCEHHLVPFNGRATIGYLPNGRVIGLSKLARIADMFARRLQVQERLTRQIADAVMEMVKPRGVAVVVECSHMCMVMRGVQKSGSSTVTRSMLGVFKEDRRQRDEFMQLARTSGRPSL